MKPKESTIVTVTPNPSVDRTLHLPELVRGAVLRASESSVHPSGKGVNVSRILAAQGRATTAVVPLGGHEGAQLAELARAEGIGLEVVAIAGRVRANVSLVEPDGTVTKVNEPGPRLTDAETTALVDAVAALAQRSAWVVGCGSLPAGAPDDLLARLARCARDRGARVAVDSSGAPLLLAIKAGVDLVKPNADELAEAIGERPRTVGDVVRGAEALRALGADAVLVSLGPDGAVLVDEHGALHGEAPLDAPPASTVGAGDALLGGFLGTDAGRRERLVAGLAWAAAACRLRDSAIPDAGDVDPDAVVLHEGVDLSRALSDAADTEALP